MSSAIVDSLKNWLKTFETFLQSSPEKETFVRIQEKYNK